MATKQELLDLLSAWQSIHALLPPHLRYQVDIYNLNQQTLAMLERYGIKTNV